MLGVVIVTAVGLFSWVGIAVVPVATVWTIVVAFRKSLPWGFACLLPGVTLVFTFTHWDTAKRPFLVQMLGLGMLAVAVLVVAVAHVLAPAAPALGS